MFGLCAIAAPPQAVQIKRETVGSEISKASSSSSPWMRDAPLRNYHQGGGALLRFALPFLLVLACSGAPKKVLYLTFTAGYRHASTPTSQQVLQSIASQSGLLEVIPSEDLSLISADNLKQFDAVFFFTSGELPISGQQKSDLLQFVQSGKGFGGVHSATDTFYTWPEYGDLIGAYFDGHPWAQQVAIDIEDPDHPAMSGLAPAFQIFDEIYQFRDFSRD